MCFNASTQIHASAAQGARLQLAPDGSSLTVEFLNRDTGRVAGPYLLQSDPDFSGGFLGTGLTGFGRTDLMVAARVRPDAGSGAEVALLLGIPGPASTRTSVYSGSDFIGRRTRLFQHWNDLVTEGNLCNGVQRFATFVQDIVDTNLQNAEYDQAAFDAIFDDLADLFIPEGFGKPMTSGYVFTRNVISDPVGSCGGSGLSSFGSSFAAGERRFRHFVANASLSRFAWGWVVNLSARVIGGDFEFLNDPTGDITADLATNQAGRDFHERMEDLFESGQLVDGHSVKDWIVNRLAETTPQTEMFVTLDYSLGPYPAGSEIALCRIRGCGLGEPEEACDSLHLHDAGEGITIDGTGPYPDPNPEGCGYGKPSTRTY